MKLTPKIIAYLRALHEKGAASPPARREPAYLHDLWLEDYISLNGTAFSITDKGRAAIGKEGEGDE